MDRLTHPSAVNGLFVSSNPGAGQPASVIPREHMNAVLLELINTIEFAGITPDAGDLTQVRQAIEAIALGSAQASNLCINPGFRVWQRGSDFSVGLTPTYTADRWKVAADGGGGTGTAQVTRQTFAPGQTEVPNGLYFLRYQQQSAPSSTGGVIKTHLEALEETSGRTLTVSFHARALSAVDVDVDVEQVTALAASSIPQQTVAVTTSWQRFALQFDVPNLDPGSLDALDRLEVLFSPPSQGTPQVDFAEVQIHLGSPQAQLIPRPFALEVSLCKRYFESSYTYGVFPGAVSTPGSLAVRDSGIEPRTLRGLFQVEKRVRPSVRWYSPYTGNASNVAFNGADRSCIPLPQVSTRDTGWPRISSAIDVSEYCEAHWTAEADF